MHDDALLREIVAQILTAIARIERRFETIASPPEDFLKSDEGIDRLDGITMMLITIGESVKNFERHGGAAYLHTRSTIDWNGVKGIRDILSHHYFDVDAEAIFLICRDRTGELKRAFLSISRELG